MWWTSDWLYRWLMFEWWKGIGAFGCSKRQAEHRFGILVVKLSFQIIQKGRMKCALFYYRNFVMPSSFLGEIALYMMPAWMLNSSVFWAKGWKEKNLCLLAFADVLENKNPNPSPTGIRFGFIRYGGDDRDRTDYLLNAIQALSQVSYAPIYHALSKNLK